MNNKRRFGSIIAVLAPALGGIAGCMAAEGDSASVAQSVVAADGGVSDGGTTPFVEAPRPPTVRTAADVAAFLDGVARRAGGHTLGGASTASLTGLVPRTPHPKRTVGWTCPELTGPSVIRFKFVDGTGIRLNQSQQFATINPGGLTSTQQTELDAINLLAESRDRAFDQTDAELLSMKNDAEKYSGEEMPDLTLWFDLLVTNTFVDPASSDSATCAAMKTRLQWLNSLSIVEVARPMYAITLPVFPSPPASTDIAPTTTTTLEPPHMGPLPGLDSPLLNPWLSSDFLPGWRGQGVAMVDIENSLVSFTHEKVNVYELPGGEQSASALGSAHALAAQSAAFGTAFSGNDEANPRYGTRGFAPNVGRGFSPSSDTCWGFFTCPDIAEAALRATQQTSIGDVTWLEVSPQSSSIVGARWNWAPAETEDDTYDVIRTSAAIGMVIIEPSGNDGLSIDSIVNDEPNSGALITGANVPVAPLGRANFSNFGSRLLLNAWGSAVFHAHSPVFGPDYSGFGGPLATLPSGTNVTGQQYWNGFNGTSSASALVAGAVAQYSAVFRQAFGHPMGRPGFDRAQMIARVAAQRGTAVASIGFQPEVVRTVADSILVTRLPACGTTIRDPHSSDASITIPSGIAFVAASWSPTGCAYSASAYNSAGATISEMEFGSDRGPVDLGYNPDRSFAIEANIRVSSDAAWQGIVAKEDPRNYSLWVTPTGGPVPGALHFSYQLAGSTTLCALYGDSRVDDGLTHHVAVRFDRRTSPTPIVSFFVDGVANGVRIGCAPGAPQAGGGAGANTLYIGRSFRPGSAVGNVRLFHRWVGDDEIAFHSANGST